MFHITPISEEGDSSSHINPGVTAGIFSRMGELLLFGLLNPPRVALVEGWAGSFLWSFDRFPHWDLGFIASKKKAQMETSLNLLLIFQITFYIETPMIPES